MYIPPLLLVLRDPSEEGVQRLGESEVVDDSTDTAGLTHYKLTSSSTEPVQARARQNPSVDNRKCTQSLSPSQEAFQNWQLCGEGIRSSMSNTG